ncbi:tetratricopeptide repeat protein [Sphingosinicella sp.]|uniref:tetratricopeptide repeat protein n=1 Tax=Sphingosinicella sp. TaxID=1917971 RepID=UPI0035B47CF5
MKTPLAIALLLALLLALAAPSFAGTGGWAAARLEGAMSAYHTGDYRTARRGFQRLAEHGSAIAETMLGVMYAKGRGVRENHAVAAGWFHRAASRGYGPAQIALSDAFARGHGVGRDTGGAYFWALAATIGGDRSAEASGRVRLKALGKFLSPEDRAEIGEDVHNWRPRAQRQR